VLLSPKLHEYEYGVVPPETVAVKVTGLLATGEAGVNVNEAVSVCGATVTALDVLAVRAFASVTVTLTVYVPLAL